MQISILINGQRLLNVVVLIVLLGCITSTLAKKARTQAEQRYIDNCKRERKAKGLQLDQFYLIKRSEVEDCWRNSYPCKIPEKFREYCVKKDTPISRGNCEARGCCYEEVGAKRSSRCYKKKEKEFRLHEFELKNVPRNGQNTISDAILEFPGCLDLKAQVVVKDSKYSQSWVGGDPNILVHLNWNLLESADSFDDLTCKNQDDQGCGGQGNDCYYCDFCKETLKQIDTGKNNERITCPNNIGHQTLHRTNLCMDDWGDLDEEKDGDPDFICFPEFEPYRILIEEFGDNGYGAVQLLIRVARNDTDRYGVIKKFIPEDKFQPIYKQEMSKMVEEDQLSCNFVIFDVCGTKPKLSPPDHFGTQLWFCPNKEEVAAG